MKLRTRRHVCPAQPHQEDPRDGRPATDPSLHHVDEAIMRMRARHVVPAQEVVDLLLDLRSAVVLDGTAPALVDSASVS